MCFQGIKSFIDRLLGCNEKAFEEALATSKDSFIVSEDQKILVSEDDKPIIVSSQPQPLMLPIIKKVDFPDAQFYKEAQKKTQIVLHHTVSNPKSSQGDVDYWKSDASRIATAYVCQYDGLFLQCFDDSYWAHHLGITQDFFKKQGFSDSGTRNVLLNKQSIAIEIDAWGGLILGDGSVKSINGKQVQTQQGAFYNAYGNVIGSDLEVEEVSWRGFKYFQKYSNAQVDAVGLLLSELMKSYGISSYGLKDGNFDISKDALSGVSGIYSHTNYRTDKSDLYPDKRIIQMLKNL